MMGPPGAGQMMAPTVGGEAAMHAQQLQAYQRHPQPYPKMSPQHAGIPTLPTSSLYLYHYPLQLYIGLLTYSLPVLLVAGSGQSRLLYA